MQVGRQPLGVAQVAVRTRPRLAGELEGVSPAALPLAASSVSQWKYSSVRVSASGPLTGPWPPTTVNGSSFRRSSRAARDPATDPISTNGVQPGRTTSPANSTRSSGSHTSVSLVVCAGPGWISSIRRSPWWRVSPWRYVRSGSISSMPPHSTSGHSVVRPSPAAAISVRVRSCATTTVPGPASTALPKVWSPWKWVLTISRGDSGVSPPRAARMARARSWVAAVSTSTGPPPRPGSSRMPALLTHQPPSGWMYANTPSASSSSLPGVAVRAPVTVRPVTRQPPAQGGSGPSEGCPGCWRR